MPDLLIARFFGDSGGCYPSFRTCPYPIPDTSTLTTLTASDQAELDTARDTVQPGERILITASFEGRLDARGDIDGGTRTAADGTETLPIVVECAPGVVLSQPPSIGDAVIDFRGVKHWHAIRCNTYGGSFGIRMMGSQNTAAAPGLIAGCDVQRSTDAKVVVTGWFASPYYPSQHARVYLNTINGIHPSTVNLQFTEGVYVGSGTAEFDDRTSDVYVGHNTITNCYSDGVEIKSGVTNFTVESNIIASIDLTSSVGPTAAVALCYGPNEDLPSDIGALSYSGVARWNRIYGFTSSGQRPCINIGRGGIDVYGNLMWDYGAVPAIRLRSEAPFGNAPIRLGNNTMGGPGWEDPGLNRQVNGGGTGPLSNVTGLGTLHNGTYQGGYVWSSADFLGPLTGTADRGLGPGSGWMLNPSSGANNNNVAASFGFEDLMSECPDTPVHAGAMPEG